MPVIILAIWHTTWQEKNKIYMNEQLSAKERAMLMALGAHNLVDLVDREIWSVWEVYKTIGEFAFLNNAQGKPAESLRRCLNAWRKCDPYRMTPEFDALIEL